MSARDTPEARQQRGSPAPVPGRCGAQLRGTNPPRYCKRYPLRGRTRCKKCGGASLRGPDHPGYRHGMFDGLLPTRLAEHVTRARGNPDLLSLLDHIALVDGRTLELFEGLTNGDAPAWADAGVLVEAARAATVAFSTARVARDGVGMAAAQKQQEAVVEQLAALIARGRHADAVWDEIKDVLILRKRLFDSEVRRQKIAHEMVPKVRVLALMSYLEQLIVRHVPDPAARKAISEGMRVVVAPRPTAIEGQAVSA